MLFHFVPATDCPYNTPCTTQKRNLKVKDKSSPGDFDAVSSDLRPFLLDTQLKSMGLDASLSPSGGEMDQIDGEAVRQVW